MKRARAPTPAAKRTMSPSSSSLRPRSTTVFVFTSGKTPAAVRTPSSTCASASRPVIAAIRSGRSVSTLTFTRWTPTSCSEAARAARPRPFVVITVSAMPGTVLTARATSSRSARSSGSPPVSRTLRTPSAAAHSTSRRRAATGGSGVAGSQAVSCGRQ